MRRSKLLNVTDTTEKARAIFKLAKSEYSFTFNIFTQDDERMIRIKQAIATQLSEPDKNVLILYCEVGSMVKTAEMLGVSKNTLRKNLDRIKETIKNALN